MKGRTKFDICYDHAFFYMWDCTTGPATNWRECYRGAKHFARFVLSELDRKEELESRGETAIVRRGLAVAGSIVSAWTFNVVEDCTQLRAPLPPELLEAIYRLMGCTHLTREPEDKKLLKIRTVFDRLRKHQTNIPTRATARELGVDPATIVRWKREPSPVPVGEPDQAEYAKIIGLTKVSEFAERASRALRR